MTFFVDRSVAYMPIFFFSRSASLSSSNVRESSERAESDFWEDFGELAVAAAKAGSCYREFSATSN